jgi:L-alanine-DL-glutamate epimerase-like enolase superfamily enzyme
MKISTLTVWSVDLTSHATYYMAEGKTCATVKTHVLCLETDMGLRGWGEVCPIPHYLPAFANGVPSAVEEMAPEILGASPFGVDALMHRLDNCFGQVTGQPPHDIPGALVLELE